MIFFANGRQHTAKYEQLQYDIYFDFKTSEVSPENLRIFFSSRDTVYTTADSNISFFCRHKYDVVTLDSNAYNGIIIKDRAANTTVARFYKNNSLFSTRKIVYNSDDNIVYESTKFEKSGDIETTRTWYNINKKDSFTVYTINDLTTTITSKHVDSAGLQEIEYHHYLSNNTTDTFYMVCPPEQCIDTIITARQFNINDLSADAIKNEIVACFRELRTHSDCASYLFVYKNNVTAEISWRMRGINYRLHTHSLALTITKTLPEQKE